MDALVAQINTVLIAYSAKLITLKLNLLSMLLFYLSHLIDARYFFECGILAFFVSSDSFFFFFLG